MNTPTLKEVKEHFKNAKSVRSHECEPACYYNITRNIHEELHYEEEYKAYYIALVMKPEYYSKYVCVWKEGKGYSEIVFNKD